MAITISISMSMTTNLILGDFVTFFHQHCHVWADYCIGTIILNANCGQWVINIGTLELKNPKAKEL